MANICSCVAGAHCDEVDENPEASRQQAVAHQYRVKIPRTTGSRHNKMVEWGRARITRARDKARARVAMPDARNRIQLSTSRTKDTCPSIRT